MSELPSAMFSIADGNEFRFARFYIVCEAIRLEALESPLIVCACRTFPRWIVKTWQDTEWNVKCGTKEIHAFCSNEFPPGFGRSFDVPGSRVHVPASGLLRAAVLCSTGQGTARIWCRYLPPRLHPASRRKCAAAAPCLRSGR